MNWAGSSVDESMRIVVNNSFFICSELVYELLAENAQAVVIGATYMQFSRKFGYKHIDRSSFFYVLRLEAAAKEHHRKIDSPATY
jgi:hypothetical protein